MSKVRAELAGHFEDEIYGLAANIVGGLFDVWTFFLFENVDPVCIVQVVSIEL